jgi:hypothetical protein
MDGIGTLVFEGVTGGMLPRREHVGTRPEALITTLRAVRAVRGVGGLGARSTNSAECDRVCSQLAIHALGYMCYGTLTVARAGLRATERPHERSTAASDPRRDGLRTG